MGTPQIIYIVLTAIGVGYSIATHGKPRGNENFLSTLIATIIVYSLLIWGGFFHAS